MTTTSSLALFIILSLVSAALPANDTEGPPEDVPPPLNVSSKTNADLDILDKLLRSYDRRALPTTHLGSPTSVSCEIFIRSFGSINPATMDYEVDLYLRQSWKDERLKTPNLSRPLDLNDPKLVQKIWKPEVFFANAKHAEFQYVTVPNVLVRVNPTGDILYMLRLKLRFSCMMDLYRYPMDSQVCGIEIASFSKTTDELALFWSKKNPVVLYENLKLPQFQIISVNTSICKERFHIGEYSCLKAEFYLQRSLGYHMVQSYLPTILIVVISWVSFWLEADAIAARVTLGVTTLLTISSKGAGIQSNLPPVSYVKAMDVWMGACTTFVFAALLEFTVANYLWRKSGGDISSYGSNSMGNYGVSLQTDKVSASRSGNDGKEMDMDMDTERERDGGREREREPGSDGSSLAKRFPRGSASTQNMDRIRVITVPSVSGNQVDSNSCIGPKVTGTGTTIIIRNPISAGYRGCASAARNIDHISRYVFPLLFLGFNLAYWHYYLLW